MVLRLNKTKIAQCFLRSIATYDKTAKVQNKLAIKLLHHLQNLPDSTFESVLEIGCCTGTLTEKLCHEKPIKKLYCNDLVPEFEEPLRKKLEGKNLPQLIPHFGDIETLPFPTNLTLIISGATFQWLSDLPSFLHRLGQELPSGAHLAFSLFGPGTLKEFSGLTAVELNYVADKQIKQLLSEDFQLVSYESNQDVLYFHTVREILSHIRDTGVGGVSEYKWTKKSLMEFETGYKEAFATADGFPVSYSASCFVARKK